MDIKQQLIEWTKEFLPPHLFLVEVEQKPSSKKVAVYIDGDVAVTIDDCRLLSKSLNTRIDEMEFESEPFYFEVSSPGVDKPLILQRQYSKHIGRELAVKLKSNTELFGKLTEVKPNSFSILFKDKKKGYLPNALQKEIAFEDVAESIVQISFKNK